MPYTAEISRTNPSCFVFLIDQSGSMGDLFGGGSGQQVKAQGVADAINKLLQNLAIKCAKAEGLRDYYHVSVLGYGGQNEVSPAFGGFLAGKEMVPISEVADNPTRIEERLKKIDDGAGGIIEQKVKFPVWFDPQADGGTPMCEAVACAQSIVQRWLSQYPNCFPPIVINITDGEATDGDPSTAAQSLKQLSSNDGNVLLFNLHVSSHRANPVEFPDSEFGLPDDYARMLFRMSSPLPEYMRKIAEQEGFRVAGDTRGFVFNADMISVIKFLDIGTRASNLR